MLGIVFTNVVLGNGGSRDTTRLTCNLIIAEKVDTDFPKVKANFCAVASFRVHLKDISPFHFCTE